MKYLEPEKQARDTCSQTENYLPHLCSLPGTWGLMFGEPVNLHLIEVYFSRQNQLGCSKWLLLCVHSHVTWL